MTMLILGVDPGLRDTGYGVVEGSPQGVRLIACGLIRTSEDAPLARRLHDIHERIALIVSQHTLSAVAVEDLYAATRFPRTAILMGHVRGVVYQVAAARNVTVVSLPPATVKQAIAGFGAAGKEQMQLTVQRLFGLPTRLDTHITDAIGTALVALSRGGVPFHGVTTLPAATVDGV
jgi:crossover junction endodeoxyribonuclease RuvC